MEQQKPRFREWNMHHDDDNERKLPIGKEESLLMTLMKRKLRPIGIHIGRRKKYASLMMKMILRTSWDPLRSSKRNKKPGKSMQWFE